MRSTTSLTWRISFAVVSAAAALLVPVLNAGTFDTLQWRNPYPTGNSYVGTAFGAGAYAVIDSAGYVLTTLDGHVWVNRGPSGSANPKLLRHLGGKFVVLGSDGSIVTSTDAITWTTQSSGTTQALVSVTYGNGLYVAVGAAATLLTSPDAVTWTARSTGLNPVYSFRGVAFTKGQFVAVNNNTQLYLSNDGLTWNPLTVAGMLQHEQIVATPDKFIVDAWYRFGPGSSYPVAWTSTNGLDWQRASSDAAQFKRLYAGEKHFALGFYAVPTKLFASTNGLTWDSSDLPASFLGADVTHGANGYFCVGQLGNTLGLGVVGFSSNGTNWTAITNAGNTAVAISFGTYGAGQYVFSGTLSNNSVLFTSADGVNYEAHTDSPELYGGAPRFLGGKFVRLGSGVISRSDNGIHWTRARSGTLKTLRGIAYGAGKWVAVGDGGEVRVSEDLQIWTGLWSGTDYPLNSVVFAQGKFMAVGHLGIIYSSTDGLNWTQQTNEDLGTLRSIVHGNGLFLAFGESLLTSQDGATWTARTLPAGYSRIDFGGGQFVASGALGRTMLTSADGINWQSEVTPVSGPAQFLNETFFLYGANGAVLQTKPAGVVVLSAAANTATGAFEVIVTGGQIGSSYKLQACTSLAANFWTDITTFVQTHAITVVPVSGGLGAPQYYYRAVSIP